MALKYLMCIAGGVAIGYAYAYSRMERDFQERLERESEDLRSHYRDKYRKRAAVEEARAMQKAETPETVAVQMAEDVRKVYGAESPVSEIVSGELSRVAEKGVVTGDISVPEEDENFVHDTPPAAVVAEDGLVEKAAKPSVINYNRISTPEKPEIPEQTRTDEAPSDDQMDVEIEVITQKSFIDDEFGYKQFSFTYFAGDDVLANEDDEPVVGTAREASVGAETLQKLKVGREAMGGENVIYVRNRTGGWEFEITRSDGKFSEEVAAEVG